MVNFLVTGGAGFIGSHVCERLLRSGDSVWAFDDLNDFYDPKLKRHNILKIQALAKPFEFVQGDLTDRAALDELFGGVKFDQVIHLAARAGDLDTVKLLIAKGADPNLRDGVGKGALF